MKIQEEQQKKLTEENYITVNTVTFKEKKIKRLN